MVRRLGPRPVQPGDALHWNWNGVGTAGARPVAPGLYVISASLRDAARNEVTRERTCWVGYIAGAAAPGAADRRRRGRASRLRRTDGTALPGSTPHRPGPEAPDRGAGRDLRRPPRRAGRARAARPRGPGPGDRAAQHQPRGALARGAHPRRQGRAPSWTCAGGPVERRGARHRGPGGRGRGRRPPRAPAPAAVRGPAGGGHGGDARRVGPAAGQPDPRRRRPQRPRPLHERHGHRRRRGRRGRRRRGRGGGGAPDPGAADRLVRPARPRPADPDPGHHRQDRRQPARAALRRDPPRPGGLGLGSHPGAHRGARGRGPAGADVAARRLRRLPAGLDPLERRLGRGRQEGRVLLHPLHPALRPDRGLVAARPRARRPGRDHARGRDLRRARRPLAVREPRHLVEPDAPAGERLQPLLPGQRDLLRPQHPGALPGGGAPHLRRPRVGAHAPGRAGRCWPRARW